MDKNILAIRLSMESQQWEEMVDRLDTYLQIKHQEKLDIKNYKVAQKEKKDSENIALQRAKTQKENQMKNKENKMADF